MILIIIDYEIIHELCFVSNAEITNQNDTITNFDYSISSLDYSKIIQSMKNLRHLKTLKIFLRQRMYFLFKIKTFHSKFVTIS